MYPSEHPLRSNGQTHVNDRLFIASEIRASTAMKDKALEKQDDNAAAIEEDEEDEENADVDEAARPNIAAD